jgi:peptide/nickel transport system permease protein
VFRRSKSALAGAVLVLLVVLAAAGASWIAPYDPDTRAGKPETPPGAAHWLGTDAVGFDVFSRVVHGARLSLLCALAAVGMALLVGVPLGLAAGWYGGWPDGIIMRIVDVMLAFPSILLAVAIAGIFQTQSVVNVIVAVGVVMIPVFIRQVRAATMQLQGAEFVVAARAVGASDARILFRTVLPNCIGPILILTTLNTGIAILDAAGLGFLGLGAPVGSAEWGVMLQGALEYVDKEQWIILPPGLAISLTVLGFNLLGDGLCDAFDPRSR